MAVHLTSITNTFFVNLLTRLGVKPPPADGFDLINTVQPVSLVDSDITLPTFQSTQLIDTPFTAGVQVAPAIGTILADTLAQAGGNFVAYISLSCDSPANDIADMIVARR
ncbi:MAG: hypothetical protein ACHQKY_17790, partial [Terriglobia bacterium]